MSATLKETVVSWNSYDIPNAPCCSSVPSADVAGESVCSLPINCHPDLLKKLGKVRGVIKAKIHVNPNGRLHLSLTQQSQPSNRLPLRTANCQKDGTQGSKTADMLFLKTALVSLTHQINSLAPVVTELNAAYDDYQTETKT